MRDLGFDVKDMIEAIDAVQRFVQGMDRGSFATNDLVKNVVVMKLMELILMGGMLDKRSQMCYDFNGISNAFLGGEEPVQSVDSRYKPI